MNTELSGFNRLSFILPPLPHTAQYCLDLRAKLFQRRRIQFPTLYSSARCNAIPKTSFSLVFSEIVLVWRVNKTE